MQLTIIDNKLVKEINFLKHVFFLVKEEFKNNLLNKELVSNDDLWINLIFICDDEIKKLNKKWRKKDSVTDVLSFPYFCTTGVDPFFDSPIFSKQVFGEIFISVSQASKQALYHNYSLKKELSILFIHGLLHLFGYDHEKDDDFFEMNKIEQKLYKQLDCKL